ncbi:MAPEG family protein [Octadecabacter temperatus]|uniref:MAPEG family protein n=2 Tax=Octadecabacter temperatus TaxID=1458307 RepID=A0A0K0Y764_9RHOB|nr:MAPEG family protein [Octadecabacter temperatus]SIO20707.1 MAPEG family protein [Octadecabacter temperatus]
MKRIGIAIGMVLGAVWAVAIVLLPLRLGLPFIPPALAIPAAFLIPGAVMAMMIGVLAARRFFNTDLIDGEAAASGTRAQIDERVLRNTTEQMVLALLVWPFVGFSLGGVSILALGIGMAVARLLFWVGYHVSPPLRSLGFAASFYPTLFGAFWAVWIWVN